MWAHYQLIIHDSINIHIHTQRGKNDHSVKTIDLELTAFAICHASQRA